MCLQQEVGCPHTALLQQGLYLEEDGTVPREGSGWIPGRPLSPGHNGYPLPPGRCLSCCGNAPWAAQVALLLAFIPCVLWNQLTGPGLPVLGPFSPVTEKSSGSSGDSAGSRQGERKEFCCLLSWVLITKSTHPPVPATSHDTQRLAPYAEPYAARSLLGRGAGISGKAGFSRGQCCQLSAPSIVCTPSES